MDNAQETMQSAAPAAWEGAAAPAWEAASAWEAAPAWEGEDIDPVADRAFAGRAEELMAQDEAALEDSGLSPLRAYERSPWVRRMVDTGAWDFVDVTRALQAAQGLKAQGAEPPAPGGAAESGGKLPGEPDWGAAWPLVRAANGGSLRERGIWELSEAQFRQLNQRLDGGEVVPMGRG